MISSRYPLRAARFPLATALTSLTFAAACVFPTDRSANVSVEFVTPAVLLVAGDTLNLEARVVDAGGAPVPRAELFFVSDDPAVVIADRSGKLRAVGRGETQIIATATGFEGARPDSLTVTVVPRLRIAAILPVPVRFGERLRVIGFGLDPAFLTSVTIGGEAVSAESFVALDPADPNSLDTLAFFVPALIPLASNVVIERFDLTATRTIVVEQLDVLEPNDSAPALVAVGFRSPSLTLEPEAPVDWYRIPVGSAEAVTITVTTTVSPQPFDVTISSRRAQYDADPSWAVSPNGRGVVCRGVRLDAPRSFSDSTVTVALTAVAGDTIDLVITSSQNFSSPIRYELAVEAEYVSDSLPDDLEENDYCDAAPELELLVRHDLNFDSPGDLDWVRVTVDSLQPFVFQALAPSAGAGTIDPNFYLFEDTAGLPLLDSAVGGGTNETLSRTLAPGSYLLLVWNGAGESADYVLQAYAGELASPPLRQISAGWNRTCALTVFGDAVCWGRGPLGDGTVADSDTPVAVVGEGGSNLQLISAGGDHTCALRTVGKDVAFCWGRNESGQVGNGTLTDALEPVRLETFRTGGPDTLLVWFHLSAGWAHTCGGALFKVGAGGETLETPLCWGRSTEGQTGSLAQGTPDLTPTSAFRSGSVGRIMASDSAHSCFQGSTEIVGQGSDLVATQIICVGDDTWDQIGQDNAGLGEGRARIPLDTAAVVVVGGNGRGAHSCAIDNKDALWCWGDNRFGQLGNPTVTGSSVNPVRVAGGMVFSTITAGGLHTCGLTAQGEAYCWGDNAVGQIGDGTTTQAGIPVAVTGGLTFQSLSAGNYHTCGVTTEGVGYCWGSGPLGVAGVTASLVPLRIG